MTGWRDHELSVVFPEPQSITGHREAYAKHVIPEAMGGPARFRVFEVPSHEHPFTACDVLIHADGTVTACSCHEPVVEGDLIMGLRPH